MFNLVVDSKLRGWDVVALKVKDTAPNDYAIDCAMVRRKKTGRPLKFEVTDQSRQAVDECLRARQARSRPTFCIEVDDAIAIAEQVDV